MNETKSILPVKIGGAEITRFNALRHGVLSRYTVLPWEDAAEYRDLVASLVVEHTPQGPTEEHLVEELAGVLWRKRRLRLAQAAAHRYGLDDALSQSRRTAKRAVVHIDATDGSEDVAEAIRATAADTEDAVRDMQEDEAMTREALDLLNSRCNDPYEAAVAALREDTAPQGPSAGGDRGLIRLAKPMAEASCTSREDFSRPCGTRGSRRGLNGRERPPSFWAPNVRRSPVDTSNRPWNRSTRRRAKNSGRLCLKQRAKPGIGGSGVLRRPSPGHGLLRMMPVARACPARVLASRGYGIAPSSFRAAL